MNLCDAKKGTAVRVCNVRLAPDVSRRLCVLGISAGVRVDVIRKRRGGDVIIRACGVRYALGRDIARGVDVEGGAS